MSKVNKIWENSAKNTTNVEKLEKYTVSHSDINILKHIRKVVLYKDNNNIYTFRKSEPASWEVSSSGISSDIEITWPGINITYTFEKFQEYMIPFVRIHPIFYTTSGFKIDEYFKINNRYLWKQIGKNYILNYIFSGYNLNFINRSYLPTPLYIHFEIVLLNNYIWEWDQQSKGV